MSAPVSKASLDEILGLQLTVAWAGEALCSPVRLGWWRTDLTDAAGGGDLLARLLPRTHAWAGLEAAREAALRTDTRQRQTLAQPDRARTLFHFGAELDERLAERLHQHKVSGVAPKDVLKTLHLEEPFSAGTLADVLTLTTGKVEVQFVPSGRQLRGPPPAAPERAAALLAAALVPFHPQYPMPFFLA